MAYANKCVFIFADVEKYFLQRPLPRDSPLLEIIKIMLKLSPTLTIALDENSTANWYFSTVPMKEHPFKRAAGDKLGELYDNLMYAVLPLNDKE